MPRETSSAKICLCVDLDADFYYLMQSYAQRSKFLALQAIQGRDVRDPASIGQPDVIFLEAHESVGQESWNALHVLKSDLQTKHIPVIVFSWLAVEALAVDEGADVFVQKPVMYADLLDALALVGIPNSHSDALPERR